MASWAASPAAGRWIAAAGPSQLVATETSGRSEAVSLSQAVHHRTATRNCFAQRLTTQAEKLDRSGDYARASTHARTALREFYGRSSRPGFAFQCRSAAASQAPVVQVELKNALDLVRRALGLQALRPDCLVKLTGKQELMAMHGAWEFMYTADGRFSEAYVGSDLACAAAFDGNNAWEVDTAGRTAHLDLDDLEVCLLSSWLRTGFWAGEHDLLDIRELNEGDLIFLRALEELPAESLDTKGFVRLAVSVPGTKSTMYVCIDKTDWLPCSAIIRAYGTATVMTLGQWRLAKPDVPLLVPAFTSTIRESGDVVITNVADIELLMEEPADCPLPRTGEECLSDAFLGSMAQRSVFPRTDLFHAPTSDTLPVPLTRYPCAKLNTSAPTEIEAYLTSTGHILVRPLINNQDVGYFILDTGASTFTIEPSVADKLDLRKFGCVHTVTVNGPAECSFRDADTFSLGPLHISNPRFVDVGGATLAHKGLPVAGICGYDIFRHSRVHIKRERSRGKATVRLLDPSQPLEEASFADDDRQITWLPFRMLSSTPHVTVRFLHDPLGDAHEAMFLLDTGAAGTDVIFSSAATLQYGLWPKGRGSEGGGVMRGMGANSAAAQPSGTGMAVMQRLLAEVEVAPGIRIKNAMAMVMAPDQNGLQLSSYTAGLICQNLLGRFDLIFDYVSNRIGIIWGQSSPVRTSSNRIFRASGG